MNAVILSFDPNEKQSVICERKQFRGFTTAHDPYSNIGLYIKFPACTRASLVPRPEEK